MSTETHPDLADSSANSDVIKEALRLSQDEPQHIVTLGKRSPLGAILSRTLPEYSGPHKVGVRDVEFTPQCERQIFGNFEHDKWPDKEAGLALDTVLFTAYYPCEPEPNAVPGVAWFPKLRQTIDGFLQMAKRTNVVIRGAAYAVAAMAIYGTTFPAYQNAPLKQPAQDKRKWPLIIFSHGVGCSRLMYSSLCGELASRGYVVCAIEHRDGTGPSSTITLEDGQTKDLSFLDWADLHWPEEKDQPIDDNRLRKEQCALRLAEIEQVIKAMKSLSEGTDIRQCPLPIAPYNWEMWNGSFDASKPIFCGHSFGGSAGLAAAADSRFDFRSVMIFDPAVERLEPWSGSISCPLLVINSHEFTALDDNERLTNLLKTASGSIDLTSIDGSTHPAISDVFLIIPDVVARMTGMSASPPQVIETAMTRIVRHLYKLDKMEDASTRIPKELLAQEKKEEEK